jgi:tetratricopeptide (TPR) repeat protein
MAEYEEIVAYHLEQAYRYRAELGPPDAHAQKLAIRAGTLLADAGERAEARADVAATVDLLSRAVELLPEDLPRRRRLLVTLGHRCYDAGDGPRAERILSNAIGEADRAGDEGASALAALVLLAVRSSTQSTEQADSLREAERLAAILARVGDEGGERLAQAWAAFLLFAMGRAGEATRRTQALVELGEGDELWQREARLTRGVAVVFGPTPVEDAIAVLQTQIDSAHGAKWVSGAYRGISRLRALQGRFAEARELNNRARAAFDDLGNRNQIADSIKDVGAIEHAAGNLDEAARLIREGYEAMAATGDRSYASTIAAEVGEVLLDLHDDDEAWRFGTIARDTSSTDDVVSQASGRAVQARVLVRRGDHDEAVTLAREAVDIMATTDYLAEHGDEAVHLAHVLREAGKNDEAVAAAREAVALYEQKGATFFVERTQRLIDEWTADG